MVVKINIPRHLLRALSYNEHKVSEGKALFIYAGNYLRDASQMNWEQKLKGLEQRNSLNDRATTKTLHLSINFGPSESFSQKELIQITSAYMEGIGFGEQPFLVYQHLDAGHPHLHVVATTIRADGTRIPTHNIGKQLSEAVRKKIEKDYHLVGADRQKQKVEKKVTPVTVSKAAYGKMETKEAITQVLRHVIRAYRYTSLEQLNALLKGFNVRVDRGRVGGRMYEAGGLVYRILDDQGKKIGVPIKASSIEGKPTLQHLEKRFAVNALLKQAYQSSVQQKIKGVLNGSVQTMGELLKVLQEKGIDVWRPKDPKGSVLEVTYIDHQTKCVFTSSELGSEYKLTALQRCLAANELKQKINDGSTQAPIPPIPLGNAQKQGKQTGPKEQALTLILNTNTLDQLLSPIPQQNYASSALLQKKRKKKQKRNLRL